MFVRSRFSPWNTDIALGAAEKKISYHRLVPSPLSSSRRDFVAPLPGVGWRERAHCTVSSSVIGQRWSPKRAWHGQGHGRRSSVAVHGLDTDTK